MKAFSGYVGEGFFIPIMGKKEAGIIKIGFIGAGTVGTALAIGLSTRGYHVAAVYSLSQVSSNKLAAAINGCCAVDSSQALADTVDLVFIATPDDAIGQVVSEIRWRPGQSVVHCSGADSTEVLEPARASGAHVGAFHPLQTFASVKQATENTPGSTFAIEAEEPLLTTLKEMATRLDGQYIELEAGDKVIYHAAAVIACNYLVSLVKIATDLWQTFDIPPEQATRALLPLLKGTLHNIEAIGIPQCLTGPIARGDIGTIRKHIEALEESTPDVLSTYLELGRQTIAVALAKGKIDKEQAEEMLDILKQPDSLVSI